MIIPTRFRTALVFLFDLAAIIIAWLGAFLIRLNFEWPTEWEGPIARALLVLLPVQLIACRWAGLYRGMWIFASLSDLKRVLNVVIASTITLLLFAFLNRGQPALPRSILVLYPLLLLLVMGGGRAAWRMWKEHWLYREGVGQGKPVVVVGAGTAGAMLVRELGRSSDWHVVALVDDDPAKRGLEISGCRVAGGTNRLPEILSDYGAKHVILAIPSAKGSSIRRVSDIATRAGASLFTVPGLSELMSGRVAINMMRPVKIEDLLGRESVNIDNINIHEMIAGKQVLVTGAGGSIGSELCRQLARFSPAAIILYEISEFALYTIEQWFKDNQPSVRIVPLAGDVKTPHGRGGLRPPSAGYRVPRRSVQARAADGDRQCLAGCAQQCAWHPECGAMRGALPRPAFRAHFDRQGRQSDQRHGRNEAHGGNGVRSAARP